MLRRADLATISPYTAIPERKYYILTNDRENVNHGKVPNRLQDEAAHIPTLKRPPQWAASFIRHVVASVQRRQANRDAALSLVNEVEDIGSGF